MRHIYLVLFLTLFASAAVFACYAGWPDERFRLGIFITFASLFLTIAFVILAEKSSAQSPRTIWLMRAVLAGSLGVCVGIVTLAGAYFLGWPQWLTVVIALPIGATLFIALCVLSG